MIDHRDYRRGGRIANDEARVFPSGTENRVEIKINDAVWRHCIIIFAIRKMHRDIPLKSIKTYKLQVLVVRYKISKQECNVTRSI